MPDASSRGELARAVRRAWDANTPPDLARLLAPTTLARDEVIDALVADAEERWERGLAAAVEHYRSVVPRWGADREVCRALLMIECSRRTDADPEALKPELRRRLPDLHDEIDAVVELVGMMRSAAPPEADDALRPGAVLGSYRLVDWLGAGSFGEVWNAWDTTLERYIALKLLPPDTGGESVLDRVLSEAQAAAALDHENIVKVHAAGRFADGGQCYIDCQLVGDPDPTPEDRKRVRVGRALSSLVVGSDGAPAPMTPREAARVMEAVCRGVAAAHARGIIHRDIKPSNILVTPSGRPLVTDFGLSTVAPPATVAADQALMASVSLQVPAGRITGTPSFMSPEQARGERATPASDVFGLGATLRFLLTCRLPVEPSGRHSQDARWDIIEQLKRREIRPLATERPDLPRDLTAVCDRAMAWDASARYVSAQQMAEDLGAFLTHHPVIASRATPWRVSALWFRRNAPIASVVAAALALGSLGAWKYVVSIGHERDRAVEAEQLAESRLVQTQDALETTEKVNQFLQSILASPRPTQLGANVTVLDAIRGASKTIEQQFKDRPLVEAAVRATLGRTFRSMTELGEARAHLDRALALRMEHLGPDHPDTLRSLRDISTIDWAEKKYADAEAKATDAYQRLVKVVGEEDPTAVEALSELAMMMRSFGKTKESRGLLEKAVTIRTRLYGAEDSRTLRDRSRLASAMAFTGSLDEAIRTSRDVVAIQERVLGPNHIERVASMNDLGAFLEMNKQYEEAALWLRRALDAASTQLPPGHASMFIGSRGLAEALTDHLGKHEEALSVFQPHFDAFSQRAKPNDPTVASGQLILARALTRLSRFEDAERHLIAARETYLAREGASGENTRAAVTALADLYTAWGRPDDAARLRSELPEPQPK